MHPPERVLRGFAVRAEPAALSGGQGQSWRAGALVLKPGEDEEQVAWRADVLAGARDAAVRVAPPVRSIVGGWTVDGWSATPWLHGCPGGTGRWHELLQAADAFHEAVGRVARPALLDRRTDPWALADRAAWDETPVSVHPHVRPVLRRLRALLEPTAEPAQLVHGDLAGNVLFADSAVPAVIDLSPYWRPRSYAIGIVVADALLTSPDGIGLLVTPRVRDLLPMVARGLVFRLLVENHHLLAAARPAAAPALERFRAAAAHVERAAH